jgi:hypothetical protein
MLNLRKCTFRKIIAQFGFFGSPAGQKSAGVCFSYFAAIFVGVSV